MDINAPDATAQPPSQPELYVKPASRMPTIRENWGKASRTTISAAVVLVIFSRGQKTTDNETLKMLGINTDKLTPYSVTLFAVPIMVGLCLWTIYWAMVYAKAARAEFKVPGYWHRIATKPDLYTIRQTTKAATHTSFFVFIFLPVFALWCLEVKFLNGAVWLATDKGMTACTIKTPDPNPDVTALYCLAQKYMKGGSAPLNDKDLAACSPKPPLSDPDCVYRKTAINSLWHPSEYGGDLLQHTPYRYDGNLTFLGWLHTYLMVAFGMIVTLYMLFYIWRVTRPDPDPRSIIGT